MRLISAASLLLLAALGCAKQNPLAPASQTTSFADAAGITAMRSAAPQATARVAITYQYIIGTEFFAKIDGCGVVDVTRSRSNGDMIELAGQGTFVAGPGGGSVTGGGTFVHKAANGDVKARGTWTAIRLAAFHSYGNGIPQGLPENFEGGLAVLKVHLSAGPDAILAVDCLVGRPPAGHKEGVTLAVNDVINFNQKQSGCTMFIRQTD